MNSKISRADAIKAGVAAIPVISILAGGLAEAAPDLRKQYKYQDKPGAKGAKCSTCALYQPDKDPKKNGKCALIPGAISPNGWCTSYAKKG